VADDVADSAACAWSNMDDVRRRRCWLVGRRRTLDHARCHQLVNLRRSHLWLVPGTAAWEGTAGPRRAPLATTVDDSMLTVTFTVSRLASRGFIFRVLASWFSESNYEVAGNKDFHGDFGCGCQWQPQLPPRVHFPACVTSEDGRHICSATGTTRSSNEMENCGYSLGTHKKIRPVG
jgi:hypothetical protein